MDQIKAEFKCRAKKMHPDKLNKSEDNDDTQVKEEFNLLRWAYEILSNEESRRKYDHWRRSGLAIPFKRWLKLNDATRKTLHWALKPKTQLMIMETESSASQGTAEGEPSKSHNSLKEVETGLSSLKENMKKDDDSKKETDSVKRTPLKRTFKTWGSFGISSKFQKYEI
ncbi:dnaJ homolog subfamily C member 12-like isoform X2 [Rhopilema esculentum]